MADVYDSSAKNAQVPITLSEAEQLSANGRKSLPDAKALEHYLGRVVATLRVHKRQVTDLQRDVDSLRSQLASAHPAQAAEKALNELTEQQRAVVLDRYMLARVEELERATEAAERARVAALSEINRVRFALGEMLSDPALATTVGERLRATLKQLGNSSIAPSTVPATGRVAHLDQGLEHTAPVTPTPVRPVEGEASAAPSTSMDALNDLFE